MGLRRDDSAVSTAYSYVLMFAVATILFTSIMWTYSVSVDQTRDRAVRQELTAVGLQVAQATSDMALSEIDHGSAERNLDLPNTVAGETYTVELNGSQGWIILESRSGVKVHVTMNALERDSEVSGTLYSSSFESSTQDVSRITP